MKVHIYRAMGGNRCARIENATKAEHDRLCSILGYTQHTDGSYSKPARVGIFRNSENSYDFDEVPAEQLVTALLGELALKGGAA